MNEPATKLDTRFSDPDAVATAWDETRRVLETAELFWISTVRPDGRPHVTPLVAVWLDGAIHFATSATEQKAVNLSRNLNQSLEAPLGVGGESLHEWMVTTKTFQQTYGNEGGTTGVDDEFTARGFDNIGAWILGRNMFGPVRGSWPDDSWQGWWGDTPPYHTPVFVLTNHPRESVAMDGGTTFHFVTDGIHAALERAREAANGQDIRLGGGVDTIRQYLQAGLIDELHLAISPILLGSGEHLFANLDTLALGYHCTEHVATAGAMHCVLTKRS